MLLKKMKNSLKKIVILQNGSTVSRANSPAEIGRLFESVALGGPKWLVDAANRKGNYPVIDFLGAAGNGENDVGANHRAGIETPVLYFECHQFWGERYSRCD